MSDCERLSRFSNPVQVFLFKVQTLIITRNLVFPKSENEECGYCGLSPYSCTVEDYPFKEQKAKPREDISHVTIVVKMHEAVDNLKNLRNDLKSNHPEFLIVKRPANGMY